MDIKKAFDHISWAQLVQKMSDLGIDDDLIGWTQFLFTNRWVELVIDRHINLIYKVETRIPQRSPVSPILFLIYISGIFLEIESRLLQITYLSFMNDLRFLSAGNSIIEIKKILKKAGKITFDWKMRNAVTYDISKIEAMLFSKPRKQKLLKQLTAA